MQLVCLRQRLRQLVSFVMLRAHRELTRWPVLAVLGAWSALSEVGALADLLGVAQRGSRRGPCPRATSHLELAPAVRTVRPCCDRARTQVRVLIVIILVASVHAAAARTWFALLFVPVVPTSTERIWACDMCKWQQPLQPGG